MEVCITLLPSIGIMRFFGTVYPLTEEMNQPGSLLMPLTEISEAMNSSNKDSLLLHLDTLDQAGHGFAWYEE